MLVGIVSDTHDNVWVLRKVIEQILERGVETVVHLGDIISPFTLRAMLELLSESRVKFVGIFGNNDGDKSLLLRVARSYDYEIHEPPYKISLGGRKLLLVHGFGGREQTTDIIYSLAKQTDYDVILYGHTHYSDKKFIDNTLVLNPGELHGWVSGKRSYALLDLDNLETELVEIKLST